LISASSISHTSLMSLSNQALFYQLFLVNSSMSKPTMYILKCANHKFYTGSTKNLERRLKQHQSGEGANFTKKHLPVELVYFEIFERIDWALYREKQIQGWSHKKKEALINGDLEKLKELSRSKDG
jgi:putative endonuclease